MKQLTTALVTLLFFAPVFSQANHQKTKIFRGVLVRPDDQQITFSFELDTRNQLPVIYILNGKERFKVDSVRFVNDSVFIKMPLFESSFKAAVSKNKWQGLWTKETSAGTQVMPFFAERTSTKFVLDKGPAAYDISGRWEAHFLSDSGKNIISVAEFENKGNKLTGSFLTPYGDYRFLDGVVTGKQLKLSTFDGSHSFLFTADITGKNQISNGKFLSGKTFTDEWTAVKNAHATIQSDVSAMYMKPGENTLNFRFPDLDSHLVSINDPLFKNKVVVIQIMGSWCPNCMDEATFLGNYYEANKSRGVEVLGLAYEYSPRFDVAKQRLLKFKKRLNIPYPLLFTGVAVTDSLRTEKTLPQVTPIKVFPSSIVVDKKGIVRKLDNGFYGPGTGEHYEAYKKEFHALMDQLLNE